MFHRPQKMLKHELTETLYTIWSFFMYCAQILATVFCDCCCFFSLFGHTESQTLHSEDDEIISKIIYYFYSHEWKLAREKKVTIGFFVHRNRADPIWRSLKVDPIHSGTQITSSPSSSFSSMDLIPWPNRNQSWLTQYFCLHSIRQTNQFLGFHTQSTFLTISTTNE